MGKHDKSGRSKNPDGQYVTSTYYMLRSDAWRGLNGNTLRVFFEFHMRFNGANNGQLFIGMDRVARVLGISKSTVSKAFKELEEKGFLVKVKEGKWVRGQSAEWRLTTQPFKNTPSTNDWRKWKKPLDQKKKRKPYGSTKQKHHDFLSEKKNLSVP